MIRLMINYSALFYCFCSVFSLFSTGAVGDPTEKCGARNSTEPYNIPDSEQCDMYYTCLPSPNATATMRTLYCPNGFRYSPEAERCLESKKVNCTGRDLDTNPILGHNACLLEEGGFLCRSGKQCVSTSQVCNQDYNCLDASDEFENCGSICSSKGCQHICIPTPELVIGDSSTAGTCLCREGYMHSTTDPKQCVDVNECDWFHSCSQVCMNFEGSHQCSCIEGFTISDRDNRSCIASNPNWKLIYATRHSVQYTEQKDLEQFGPVEVTNVGRPVAVTYDARSGLTYWTDASDNSEAIYRKSITGKGGSEEIVADAGIILPEGIAYDWITGNVYFADSNQSHIAVCGNSSNFCSVVVREVVDKPRDIALDPNQGIMVWTEWGTFPAIMRSGMDGSFPNPIVTTDLQWPNGITIDQGNSRVYWVDASMDKVETVLIDGRDRQVVISIRNSHLFGVDVLGDRIFWSDWSNFNIKSANKLTGGNKKVHVMEEGVLMNGLAVYHIANQPITRLNPCLTARCSHICTLSVV